MGGGWGKRDLKLFLLGMGGGGGGGGRETSNLTYFHVTSFYNRVLSGTVNMFRQKIMTFSFVKSTS